MSALVIVSALVVGLLIRNALGSGDGLFWAWCGGLVLRLWRYVRIGWFAYFAFQTAMYAYVALVWVGTGGVGFTPPIGHHEPAFFSGLSVLLLVTGFHASVSALLWWSLWGRRSASSMTEGGRRRRADTEQRTPK